MLILVAVGACRAVFFDGCLCLDADVFSKSLIHALAPPPVFTRSVLRAMKELSFVPFRFGPYPKSILKPEAILRAALPCRGVFHDQFYKIVDSVAIFVHFQKYLLIALLPLFFPPPQIFSPSRICFTLRVADCDGPAFVNPSAHFFCRFSSPASFREMSLDMVRYRGRGVSSRQLW
jgi:hypothetical protein